MTILLIVLALVFGLASGIFLSNNINKIKSVQRSEWDALTASYNETATALGIIKDRHAALEKENAFLVVKLETSEAENKRQQELLNSLNQNLAEKNSLNKLLSENLQDLKQESIQQVANASSAAERLFKLNGENQNLTAKLQAQIEQTETQKEMLKKLTDQVAGLQETLNGVNAANSGLEANNKMLTERLANQKEEIIEIQKTAHLQFEKIANQILEEKSGKFTEANKANIEALLKPLGENINIFKKKVEETYDKESKERFSLEKSVKDLVEETNKISAEANNLASALKGHSKKQGNWGEMILESILQQSGLVKDRQYFLQQTIKDEEGKSLRPDVLIKLTDERIIIIDSKVSLIAYDRYSSADSADEQAIFLKEHILSIYTHIDDLHSKNYDNLPQALDFTMMFIPIEPAYLISIQQDQDLWSYAYAKRILLISPTNLIACLKLMADLWKRELQSKNAMEIVKRGELLYEKFVSFAGSMEEIGKHISKTQAVYNTAIGQLNSGAGHLVGQAKKLKDLGLKSSKEIPVSLLPIDDMDDTVKLIE